MGEIRSSASTTLADALYEEIVLNRTTEMEIYILDSEFEK